MYCVTLALLWDILPLYNCKEQMVIWLLLSIFLSFYGAFYLSSYIWQRTSITISQPLPRAETVRVMEVCVALHSDLLKHCATLSISQWVNPTKCASLRWCSENSTVFKIKGLHWCESGATGTSEKVWLVWLIIHKFKGATALHRIL